MTPQRHGIQAGLCVAALGGTFLLATHRSPAPSPSNTLPHPAGNASSSALVERLPLKFERNEGQTDASVRFFARGTNHALFLKGTEAVLTLARPAKDARVATDPTQRPRREARREVTVLRSRLVGANPSPRLHGEQPAPGTTNYFLGNDPARWRHNVPSYDRVRYDQVYPGVDLVYYGNGRELEHDFVVAPGADPRTIQVEVDGVEGAHLDARGDLVLQVPDGEVQEEKPVLYQIDRQGNRVPVQGRFRLAQAASGGCRFGFEVGEYDRTRPLVIDPVISYATYLGGSGLDIAYGVAADANGNAWVVGYTQSTDLPTTGSGYQSTKNGSGDLFVARIDTTKANDFSLVYMTYLGGGRDEGGFVYPRINVDALGNAYLTGETDSTDFPQVNRMMPPVGGQGEMFVSKLSPDGTQLLYSTLVNGSHGYSTGGGIASDGTYIYATGSTTSDNFPVVGGFQTLFGGGYDVVAVKIDPSQSGMNQLVYSTFLGGTGGEQASGCAIDSVGSIYLTGYTTDPNYPTVNALQSVGAVGNLADAIIAKIVPGNPVATQLQYSSYYGGNGHENFSNGIGAIAVDPQGMAYITGQTASTDLPTTVGAYQPSSPNGLNGFVAKFDCTKSGAASLVYGTYIGGNAQDIVYDIKADALGQAWVSGTTESSDFKLVHQGPGVPSSLGINTFVVGLKADGSGAVYSTILSGGNTQNDGIALGATGEVYVVGLTTDNGIATATGFQTTYQNNTDGYLRKLDTSNHPPTANGGPDQTVPCAGAGVKTAVLLDGSASTDPDLDVLTYHWTEGEVPLANSKKPTVQLSAGTHTIALTVTDPYGASSTDTVVINVNCPNNPPTANAGANQNVSCNPAGALTSVTLDGSGSSDPDGDALTYVWSENGTQLATGVNPTVQLSTGTHTITLTVTDTHSASASATVTITITCPNRPPVANAGPAQNLPCTGAATSVSLDGSASSDPDGDALTYVWTENGQQIATGVKPTVSLSSGPHTTTLTITLTVTDTHAASSSANVTISINCPNHPPVANGGPNQNVPCNPNGGTVAVMLDGSGSSDPDGDPLSYHWVENGVQIATGVKPTVQLAIGVHVITLTVMDNHDTSNSTTVTITVACPNHPPVANAGPDQTLQCGGATTTITLDGSASTDPDSDPLTYAWSEGGQPLATGVSPGVNLAYGAHTITLTVMDNHGASSSDIVVITIQDTVPPVVHLPVDGIRVQQTSAAGAVVNFAERVTATDNCGTPTVDCQPPSGSTFPPGNNSVVCTATDGAGNHSSAVLHVIVVDSTAPTINCPSDLLMTATSPQGATVNFTVTASDNGGTANVTTQPASGSVFPLGDTVVQCTATDASQNTATCSFHVRVVLPDVTNLLQITAGKAKTSRTGVQIPLTITNNSDATILPNAWLVIANLPAGVTLTGGAGVTTLATPPPTPVGSPYLALKIGKGLKAKKSVKVVVKFAKPTTLATVTYTAQVLAGGGNP